jgi:hypothetical protein
LEPGHIPDQEVVSLGPKLLHHAFEAESGWANKRRIAGRFVLSIRLTQQTDAITGGPDKGRH